MNKRWISASLLVVYSALLINVVIFKNIPVLRIGHMRFRFGGSYPTGEANLTPLKTIGSYLRGDGGRLSALVNLWGNILPFAPIGFFAACVFRSMTWPKAFALAVATGLMMETMEVLFHVGIFDIDDVLLNALGVLLGYGIAKLLHRPPTLAPLPEPTQR